VDGADNDSEDTGSDDEESNEETEDDESQDSQENDDQESKEENEADSGEAQKKEVLVKSQDGNVTDFKIKVDGNLTKGKYAEEEFHEGKVDGAVNGYGVDNYYFTGEIEKAEAGKGAAVYVDGDKVSSDETSDEKELVLIKGESSKTSNYTIEASESLSKGRHAEETVQDDSKVEGKINGRSLDSYYFRGKIQELQIDGDPKVYTDREKVEE